MQRIAMLFACVTGLVLLGQFWLFAQSQQRADEATRTITTTGQATVSMKPDAARLWFSIRSMNEQLQVARQENQQRTKAVREALASLQDTKLKSVTREVDVSLIYNDPRSSVALPKVIGYQVNHRFSVVVESDDPGELNTWVNQVFDLAIENGVNDVDSIDFFRKDDSEFRQLCRKRAVEDALANARALANGANLQLKDVQVIRPSRNDYSRSGLFGGAGNSGFGGGGTGFDVEFLSGNRELSTTVEIVVSF